MKRLSSYIVRISGIAIVAVELTTRVAHAQTVSGGLQFLFGISTFWDFMLQLLASLANTLLMVGGFFVAVSAAVMNVSISLSLHISAFVNNTPAIFQVWTALRDVSGIFVIFALLYAAIRLILGFDAKFGDLIKNIVIAGVLINFSFFAVSVLIDASNIVSLSIFNAMIPPSYQIGDATITTAFGGNTGALGTLTSSAINGGGIAAIFMQSFKIQSIYNSDFTKNTLVAGAANGASGAASAAGNALAGAPIRIIMIGIVGFIMMLVASLGFLAASLMFIVRFILLLFLLMFSPIWCASFVIPGNLGKAKTMYKSQLISQLIFMPAYLLLTWVALVVLNGGTNPKAGTSGWLGAGATNLWTASSANWVTDTITLVINLAIVAIMLAIPLIVSISLGGWASEVGVKWADPRKLWKSAGNRAKGAGAGAYQNTVGRGASRLARSESFQRFAGSSRIGEWALKGTRATGGGFDKKLTTKIASRESFAQSLNRQGAAAYAQRLSTSPTARISMMGTIGRSNRVGSARILNTRLTEVTAENNRLTSELNQINNAANLAGGLGNLPMYQRQRHDELNGTNAWGANAALRNDILTAQTDMNNIRNQVNAFQANTGASIRDTTRRNY